MRPTPGGPPLPSASRASSIRLSARAWLTWPRESGSDQRSWTSCSCRTSDGVVRLAVAALRVVRVGVHGPLLGLGEDRLGLLLRVLAAPGRLLLGQQLGPRLHVLVG